MDKFKEKLNTLDDVHKRFSFNYFTKQEVLTNMTSMVSKSNKIIRSYFGNFNAKVCFVVDFDKTNDLIIDLIKKFYARNNAEFYSLYITSYNKFGKKDIDEKFLTKELEVINPSRVVFLGDTVSGKFDSINLNKDELNVLIDCLADKENTKKHNNYKEVRENFIECIKFALYGRKED